MNAKPAKTAADYMAMAVCPVLIMVLVGSLVFFLLQTGYEGGSLGRLRWTLFWFVFAMVLVSRIAIEQSQGAAFLYGLALAGATSLMLARYIGFSWGVWLLLGLIWWASNKIVWDCTLIDEDQDASGEGLLRLTGWQQRYRVALRRVRAVAPEGASDQSNNPARPDASAPKQPHAPGLWVLYFSFAAVPVFGLGELFLARGDAAGKRLCFLLLFAYLSAAAGLLLLTSFLGLRRYLRQRYLVMPPQVVRSWITTGTGLAVSVLLISALLPRPNTPYSLAAFVTKLTTPLAERGEPSSRGESTPDNSAQQGSPAPSEPQAPSQRQGRSTSGSGTRVSPPVPAPAIQAFQWLPYVVAAVILAIALVRFWPEISSGFAAAMARAKRRRPKRKKGSPSALEPDSQAVVLLPDPFQTGQAARMSLADLVFYTFDGLRRWARSRGFELAASETPLEFAERLSTREPVLAGEIRLVSRYVSHLAYAGQLPGEEALQVMKRLWSVIGFNRNPR